MDGLFVIHVDTVIGLAVEVEEAWVVNLARVDFFGVVLGELCYAKLPRHEGSRGGEAPRVGSLALGDVSLHDLVGSLESRTCKTVEFVKALPCSSCSISCIRATCDGLNCTSPVCPHDS